MSTTAVAQQGGGQGDTISVCIYDQSRSHCARTSASATVLSKNWDYFRANAAFTGLQPPTFELLVRKPEHLELGVALLAYLHTRDIPKAIYQSEAKLLVLIDLSVYYGIPDLADDCLQCLLPLLHQQPQWTTLLYLLSESTTDPLAASEVYVPCRALAKEKALARLGSDLEGIMQHTSTAAQLLSLPYPVFLHLMRSCETRVCYESTICGVITYWLAGQPQGSISREQKRELASCVCLRGVPHLYISSILPYLAWWDEAVNAITCLQALGMLSTFGRAQQEYNDCHKPEATSGSRHNDNHSPGSCSSPGSPSSKHAMQLLAPALNHMPPHESEMWRLWLRDQREPSQQQQLVLTASLGQEQLAAAYNARGRWQGTPYRSFAGMEWQLCYRFAQMRVGTGAAGVGDSNGSRPATMTATSRSSRVFQLQVGISFTVFGVSARGEAVAKLAMRAPTMRHPLAVPQHPGMLTRAQLLRAGLEPTEVLHLLPLGDVLTCLELLPTQLAAEAWDDACWQRMQRLLDSRGRLRLRVEGGSAMC